MSGRYIMARRSDATSSRSLCSVVVASSQAAQATARAVVAIGTQCARFFSVGEATQTDVAVFCSTGSQTESKYSDVDADILRSGSPCERCNRFFISQNSAEKHWRFKRVDEPLGQPVGKHRCSYCPYSNKIRKSIKGHQKVSSGGEPHARRFCPQQYHPQNAELTVHDSTGDTPYVCSVCQKRFPQKTGLLAHEREHTGAKPYACRICPKTYHGKDSRRLHEKKHARSGELFFCSVCHKGFVYASDVVIHEKVHATMKPYTCRFCPDSFLQSSDLTTHERGHTDERLHVCSVCSKCFPRASQLALHERVHTGDKPYFCTVCSKPFTQIHYLTAHERMHTTEKPYGCIVCQKRFALKGSLVKHILGKVGSHCCKKLKRGEHGDKDWDDGRSALVPHEKVHT